MAKKSVVFEARAATRRHRITLDTLRYGLYHAGNYCAVPVISGRQQAQFLDLLAIAELKGCEYC